MIPSLDGSIEVICLFAVAVLISWPALKKYLPELPKRAIAVEPRPPQRFVPKGMEGESAAAAMNDLIEYVNGNGSTAAAVYNNQEDEEEEGSGKREGTVWGAALETVAKRPMKSAAELFPSAAIAKPVEKAPEAKEMRTILLADPREKVRTAMLLRLARSGYRVFPVTGGREAVDLFTRQRTDVVFLNFEVLKSSGADLVRRIRTLAPFVPILVPGAKGSADHLDIDVTMIPHGGDDPELMAEMVECALAASKCIDRARADQDVRSRILSELCHNLRSSLEVIHGYTEFLHDEPDLSRFHDLIDRVRLSTVEASAQMQTYVDLSFLELPDEVRHDRVDLSTFEEKIERLVSRQIGEHPLRLTTSGPLQGGTLVTDGDRLLAILAHIVTDALRFTPTGEINIAVKALPERTDFIVSDLGPGISVDVPMPFAALPKGDENGIGLTIAERLSESIGASLTGACGEGGAASFTLSVPSKLLGPTSAPPLNGNALASQPLGAHTLPHTLH